MILPHHILVPFPTIYLLIPSISPCSLFKAPLASHLQLIGHYEDPLTKATLGLPRRCAAGFQSLIATVEGKWQPFIKQRLRKSRNCEKIIVPLVYLNLRPLTVPLSLTYCSKSSFSMSGFRTFFLVPQILKSSRQSVLSEHP